MNKIQRTAYELIRADARFLYTLNDVYHNVNNIKGNFILMSQPYMGIFTYGAEQWCQKVGLNSPKFNDIEKRYYTVLRQSHKLFEKTVDECIQLLEEKLKESDEYFYQRRSRLECVLGYSNIGADIFSNEYCGNTVLCAAYSPVRFLENKDVGEWIKNMFIVTGRIAAFMGCNHIQPYAYNTNIRVIYRDYHFYNKCPLKMKNAFGLLLFSVLCSINYAVKFMDALFLEENLPKFKIAYLLYYYLCNFIKEINVRIGTSFYIDDSICNRSFRNCMTHYGLGQFISEDEILEDDILKGLTNKAFDMDYYSTKNILFNQLNDLSLQIKDAIF